MINDVINYFKDKRVLILGFGREGKSTYKLIRENYPSAKIYIADKKEDGYELLENDKNVQLIVGENYLKDLEQYDVIMKSPGVSLKNIDVTKIKDKIKSQLELLLEFLDVYTIGITGTKGKSTTSTLIYEMLKMQGKEVLLMGNIGVPAFDCLDKMKEKMYIVLEMSSHQLEYMDYSPNISILLNVYEEHLDHYKSFDTYIEAKCNIFSHQKNGDFYIYNNDISKILEKNLKYETKATKFAVTLEGNKDSKDNIVSMEKDQICINDRGIYNINEKRKLLGTHNLNNIMFVLTVSEILKLDIDKTIECINNFEGLPHRIEFVGEYDGITFYNDSIATIPEATINSVEALKEVNTLIVGGIDRGVNLSKFIKYLNNSNIQNLVCLPTTGHNIAKQITNENINTFLVENMEEAVDAAKKHTKKGMICLLSPAAASYGFFKNFEDRGNKFKELVRKNV